MCSVFYGSPNNVLRYLSIENFVFGVFKDYLVVLEILLKLVDFQLASTLDVHSFVKRCFLTLLISIFSLITISSSLVFWNMTSLDDSFLTCIVSSTSRTVWFDPGFSIRVTFSSTNNFSIDPVPSPEATWRKGQRSKMRSFKGQAPEESLNSRSKFGKGISEWTINQVRGHFSKIMY